MAYSLQLSGVNIAGPRFAVLADLQVECTLHVVACPGMKLSLYAIQCVGLPGSDEQLYTVLQGYVQLLSK